MSLLQEDLCHDSNHVRNEKSLLLTTMQILDEEKETILSEVLRCYVCLEIPKGKQVRICEEGHHCCITCHAKIKFCGICRGALLEGRNFVVEQLVHRLGPILGIPKFNSLSSKPTTYLIPGSFPCPYTCRVKMPAFRLVSHFRERHSSTFLENVRANSFSGHFSVKISMLFIDDERYVYTVQVADMGLFTIELNSWGLDLLGCVRMLAKKETVANFRYQIMLRLPQEKSEFLMEYSAMNCRMSSFCDNLDTVSKYGCLKVRGDHIMDYIEVGALMEVFVSIWEKSGIAETRAKVGTSLACVPDRHMYFKSDRKKRRNRNRNLRRKTAKALKISRKDEKEKMILVKEISKLSL